MWPLQIARTGVTQPDHDLSEVSYVAVVELANAYPPGYSFVIDLPTCEGSHHVQPDSMQLLRQDLVDRLR